MMLWLCARAVPLWVTVGCATAAVLLANGLSTGQHGPDGVGRQRLFRGLPELLGHFGVRPKRQHQQAQQMAGLRRQWLWQVQALQGLGQRRLKQGSQAQSTLLLTLSKREPAGRTGQRLGADIGQVLISKTTQAPQQRRQRLPGRVAQGSHGAPALQGQEGASFRECFHDVTWVAWGR